MNRRIVIAGGSGFLGRGLAEHFRAQGDTVTILTRRPDRPEHLAWDGRSLGSWAQVLEGSDVLINLAGRSVNCRYHARNRAEIVRSRLDSTRVLGAALDRCKAPPPTWLNASTATIYRHAEDRPMDEATGEIGTGFSVEVARAWEEAFFAAGPSAVRRVALRMSMVMGPGAGGPFATFHALVRWGLGGPMGPGTQFVSWIHEHDLARAIEWILDRPDLSGAINVTAPHPRPNREFLAALRAAAGRRLGLPAPRPLLELGALLLRTETELPLKSRRVIPARLQASGFTFLHPELDGAFAEILSRPTGASGR